MRSCTFSCCVSVITRADVLFQNLELYLGLVISLLRHLFYIELDLDVDLAGGAEDIVAHLGERIPDLVATAIVVCLAIMKNTDENGKWKNVK